MNIPSQIVAGDSVQWIDVPSRDSFGNSITPPSWALTYNLNGASKISKDGVAMGSGWAFELLATETTVLAPGVVYWQAVAKIASQVVTVGSGRILIVASLLAASAGYDPRSQDEKDLDAVQGAIRAMITGGAVQEYAIAGRSVRKMTLEDLHVLESRLKARVVVQRKREMIRNGQGNPHFLGVRFK